MAPLWLFEEVRHGWTVSSKPITPYDGFAREYGTLRCPTLAHAQRPWRGRSGSSYRRRTSHVRRADRSLPGSDRRGGQRCSGLDIPRSGTRTGAGTCRGRGSPQRAAAGRAPRRSGGDQGRDRYGGHAHREWHAAARGAAAAPGGHGGVAAARGRRRHHGQDGDDRACCLLPGQDTQPARPRAHARRLVERICSSGRRRDGPARAGHSNEWVGDTARFLLRRGRLQADSRADLARGNPASVATARSRRRVRARCRMQPGWRRS